jgi:hypothetical protein
LPVTTTTTAVTTGYAKHSTRSRRPASMVAATAAVQVAQARCSDGIAAYWSAGTGPVCEAPNPAAATASTYPPPGSSRGGITGSTTNTTSPATLVSASALRASRYVAGRRR